MFLSGAVLKKFVPAFVQELRFCFAGASKG